MNNGGFQQTEDIVDAKGHHRRQRRPDYQVDEDSIPAGFSNVAFEQDDQQSVTPPPPYPSVDSQVLNLLTIFKSLIIFHLNSALRPASQPAGL